MFWVSSEECKGPQVKRDDRLLSQCDIVGNDVVRSTRRVMVKRAVERRKTTRRFQTQRSEWRRNVDEDLLVTRECVSLEVMPSFQMSGILLLKMSPDGCTKTPGRAHLRSRNSTARFSACESLCDPARKSRVSRWWMSLAVPCPMSARRTRVPAGADFPHCFETASRGSLWRLGTFCVRHCRCFG
jgi:hypothetical protein